MEQFFKSVIDQDRASVVICDLNHTVIYMNPAAVSRYHCSLVGKSLMDCHNEGTCGIIRKVIAWFQASGSNQIVHTFYNEKEHKDVYMVALRDDSGSLIGYYEKHEYRDRDMTPLYEMKP